METAMKKTKTVTSTSWLKNTMKALKEGFLLMEDIIRKRAEKGLL